MGHLKIVVDHEKLEYEGPLSVSDLFRSIQNFFQERGFDYRQDKDFEHHTPSGTQIEWQISPWKIISDYARHLVKVRILAKDLAKVDVMKDGKKIKVENGKIIIIIDGFIETDVDSRWDERPFFVFLRTVYDKFVYRMYTERFEQRLTHDVNQLVNYIKQFLNVHRRFVVISRQESNRGD